jgi:hypothetical protein
VQRNVVRPSFDGVIALVEELFGLDEGELRRRSHHPARKALARLASHEAGVAFTLIGEWMGISGPAASKLALKAIALAQRDAEFAERLATIRQRLRAPGDGPSAGQPGRGIDQG